MADKLRKEERESGRSRRWRSAFRRLNQQLASLETEETALEMSFPQVPPTWPLPLCNVEPMIINLDDF